jgi:acyl-CoA oxidase
MESRNITNEPRETPLGVFLWGGKDKFNGRKQILKALTSNPVFSKRDVTTPSLARKDAWRRAVFQARELIALKQKEKWTDSQFRDAIGMLDYFVPVQPQFRSIWPAPHYSLTLFVSDFECSLQDEPGKADVR